MAEQERMTTDGDEGDRGDTRNATNDKGEWEILAVKARLPTARPRLPMRRVCCALSFRDRVARRDLPGRMLRAVH